MRWSTREDAFLRALWSSWHSLDAIARFLVRSRSATLRRARTLRLGPGPGVSLRMAAQVLGVSRDRVLMVAREAGVRSRRAPDRAAHPVEPRRRRRVFTRGQLERIARAIAPELAADHVSALLDRRLTGPSRDEVVTFRERSTCRAA